MMALYRSFILIVILTALTAHPAQGQTVRGIVRDSDGRPLAGARITLQWNAGTIQTTTSGQGTFELSDVPQPATISVTSEGFASWSVPWSGEPDLTIVLKPASLAQQVIVTATRNNMPLGDVAASVSTIQGPEIAATPALVIDNVLREVPGFSLFRRSDSRTANPTAQGASLRGLGASGASRALVLLDGVPLNDPFGGWIYWDRIPVLDVQSVEVLSGGASALYGSGALAGVVSFASKRVDASHFSLEVSGGNQGTQSGAAVFSRRVGRWSMGGAVQGIKTEGYIPVRSDLRGSDDTFANVRYGTGRLTLQRQWTKATVFVAGDLFNESRQNGTFLQKNDTRLGEGTGGADLQVGGGNLALRFFGSAQRYNQTFSAVSADRSRESLARTQTVPAQQAGTSAQWTRALATKNVLVVGADVRQVRGHTDEFVFLGGSPSSHVLAGGRQLLAGGFAEDTMEIGSRLHVTAATRVDSWRNYSASSATTPLSGTGTSTVRRFPVRSDVAFSPSLGAVLKLTRLVSVTGSGYGAFRNPTLNDLYRAFRLGNVQTTANSSLNPERLWGGEAGVNIGSDSVFGRARFFWDDIHDAIGNRTVEISPTLITRQRQNLGVLRARGVEVEVRADLPHHLWTRTAYEFSDSTVIRTLETPLLGLRVPQVPRHAASVELGYLGRRWTATAVGRYVGLQYDDDLNRFPLPGYFAADGFVGFRFTAELEVYVAAENILDRAYLTRTPVPTIGSPRFVRGGLRFSWSPRK